MTVTRMTMLTPVSSYSWEATSEEVARRYGVPLERILRFDLNTSPAPPGLVWSLLAGRSFAAPLSEYPPSDYRSLVEAAAAAYGVGTDEIMVGAGADEVLEITCKALLAPGDVALVAPPTYSMYRVITEQRGGRPVTVPRGPAEGGFGLDVEALRRAARDTSAALIWLCNPNNPTALADPLERIASLLAGLRADAAAEGSDPPAVVIDEAYAEYVGWSAVELRSAYPGLVVIRTASKAYGLAGLRVGFALARPELVDHLEVYRPPGSLTVVSITVVEAALRDQASLHDRVRRTLEERGRFARALGELGWTAGPSVTNFLLVRFGSPDDSAEAADGLLREGLVPRTFGPDHPLADHLRFTVRTPEENDRFLTVARRIAVERGLRSPRGSADR